MQRGQARRHVRDDRVDAHVARRDGFDDDADEWPFSHHASAPAWRRAWRETQAALHGSRSAGAAWQSAPRVTRATWSTVVARPRAVAIARWRPRLKMSFRRERALARRRCGRELGGEQFDASLQRSPEVCADARASDGVVGEHLICEVEAVAQCDTKPRHVVGRDRVRGAKAARLQQAGPPYEHTYSGDEVAPCELRSDITARRRRDAETGTPARAGANVARVAEHQSCSPVLQQRQLRRETAGTPCVV